MSAPSPLDTLDDAFALLVAGPYPLALEGAAIGCGLPARPIPLDELRSILLHPSCSFAARDAALTALVHRARMGEPAWTVGLAGVLLPGLRRTAGRLTRGYPCDTADVDAEVLAGLLEALDRLDPAGGRVAARLLWAAYRRGDRLRKRELGEVCRRAASRPRSLAPRQPWGHPDLVLARAVAEGVVTGEQAELIGATRIGDVPVGDLAAELGVTPDTLRHRRRRAERRLVAWLRG